MLMITPPQPSQVSLELAGPVCGVRGAPSAPFGRRPPDPMADEVDYGGHPAGPLPYPPPPWAMMGASLGPPGIQNLPVGPMAHLGHPPFGPHHGHFLPNYLLGEYDDEEEGEGEYESEYYGSMGEEGEDDVYHHPGPFFAHYPGPF